MDWSETEVEIEGALAAVEIEEYLALRPILDSLPEFVAAVETATDALVETVAKLGEAFVAFAEAAGTCPAGSRLRSYCLVRPAVQDR